MVKRLTMILAGLFLSIGMALAQSQVSGTVVDENGDPVVGAAVRVAGTKTGTVTDVDGKFSISAPSDSRLEISYIGMQQKTVKAGRNIRISLLPDNHQLDEVMVVAYGTQKKSSFTGAASTFKSDNLEKLQVSNVSKALEGTVAGVTIASESGTPGSSAKILVRGIGSISSSQSPLIVVDGVPYEGSLNSLSSQDIETMTVLKDAAANSMYGARGANGVIIITTKGSKAGKAKVTFDARLGINARGVGNYDIISDPGEYYEMMFEAYRNSLISERGYAGANDYAAKHLISDNLKYNIYKGIADDQIINPLTGKLNPNATQRKWTDDWTKDPFRNGVRQEYNVNVTGGTEKTQAYLSAGYLNDEGYMPGSGFERASTRVKVDQQINDHIKVGGNLAYAKTNMRQFADQEGSNYSNIFQFSQGIAPIYPIYLYDKDGGLMYDEDGNRRYDFGTEYVRPYASEANPLAVAEANINKNVRDNLSSRGYFEAKFLNDFTFTLNVAYDVFNENQVNFATPIGGDAKGVGGRGYRYATRRGAFNANQILDWRHLFDKHEVHLMGVHENKKDKYNYFYGHMTQFADFTNPEFANAAQYQELNSYMNEYALEGYLLKGEYSYVDRYYLTASIRRDGSSRFGKDVRWGTFWALGGAWRISEEPWFAGLKKQVSNLKLKASYGTQGNDKILDENENDITHAYHDQYSVDRVNGYPAFSKTLRGNKSLTWEKQAMFNAGFELGLYSRVNVNFDFFVKNNNDMLFRSPLAASEGTPSFVWRNEVNMRNVGFEVDANADIIKNSTVVWNVNLNFTHYKNKLTKLPDSKAGEEFKDGFERGYYWWKKGSSIYNWSGYEYLGVDPKTGKPQYNKYTPDGKGGKTVSVVNNSSEATVVNLNKSAIPDLTGGLGTTVQAYGFDLSVQTAFQLGGWVRDNFYSMLMNTGIDGTNFHKDMFNRWTPTHTDTNIPALNYGVQNARIDGISDFFLIKGSYLSLRNVTLGYTIPKDITGRWGISQLRVYFAGDNMGFISKRKGFDPRQSFSGDNGYHYSPISTYSFGLNLTF
ncbi:TonB-linked outer membrane protein, SusC/RagA family [Prevotella dentalis DSM 3688]|nr:TonB-dependent receptor [Prevotella dentalis]AGB27475.1 TonB-linked outer membrane protein, SusC/RagA family [Prevotella dentalis DSM 3688]